jgi:hypothetical protein
MGDVVRSAAATRRLDSWKAMFSTTAIEERLRARAWFFEPHTEVRHSRIVQRWHFRDPLNRWLYHLYGPSGEPAVVFLDWATRVKVREEWRLNRLHRDKGPAVIVRDPVTGRVTEEAWYCIGRRHRIEGPAVVRFDAATGLRTYEEFWRNGRAILKKNLEEGDGLDNRTELVGISKLKRYRLPTPAV